MANTTTSASFVELVDQAEQNADAGKKREALEFARQAEAQYADIADTQAQDNTVANALNHLGVIFFHAGYNNSARSAYQAAQATLPTGSGQETLHLATSLLNNLGQVEARLGRFDVAEQHLREAVRLREAAPDRSVYAFALDNLGSVLSAAGRLEEALSLHEQALERLQRLGPAMASHAATTLGNLAGVFESMEDFERAEAYRLRALDSHLTIQGAFADSTLLDVEELGGLYLRLRKNDRLDWVVNYLLAAGGHPPDPSFRFAAEMLEKLATKAHNEFRLDLSERLLVRAVDLLKVCEVADAPATLSALSLLSNAQRAAGNLQQARDTLKRVLEGYERLNDKQEAAKTRIELGRVYRELGAYPLAGEILQQSVAELRSLPDTDPDQLASALGNLAEAYYNEGQHALAAEQYAAALDVLAAQPDSVERPWLEHGLALLRYHLGAYAEARELLGNALRRWKDMHGEAHPFVATCAANMALLHWSGNAPRQAVAAFAEAEVCRDLLLRRTLALGSEAQRCAFANEQQADLHKVISFCLAHHANAAPGADARPDGADASREIDEFAAQLLLRRKGLVLDSVAHTLQRLRDGLGEQDRVTLDQLNRVQARIAEINAPSLLLGVRKRSSELVELMTAERELQAALSHQSAIFDPELEPVALAEVQERLPPGVLLMEYLKYTRFEPTRDGAKPWREERYALMCLDASGPPSWFDLGPAEAINASVDELRKALRRRRPMEEISAPAAALHRALIAPAQAKLADASHILIAPDDQLALAPFGLPGVVDDGAGSATRLVSYVATGRDLVRSPTAVAASPPVVVAAPDFDAELHELEVHDQAPVRTRAGFAPLPGTITEGEDVARLLGDAELVSGSAATAERVRRLQSPHVLHIATHGAFAALPEPEQSWEVELIPMAEETMLVSHATSSQVNPMFYAGLVFAGVNRQTSAANAAVLTAQEIANMDLRGTELVVLSACETGLGHVRRGEEFTGLRRALAIAGAATQVTSLWKVDDLATQMLMGHYYHALGAGQSRAEALVEAQRRTADDAEHPDWSHPFYWAAFVSVGDWRPLEMPQA